MREIERRLLVERPRLGLRRAADGTLRPASDEADIADIWADQKRIQLKEAMEKRQRRALKKQQRQERKLLRRSPAAPASGQVAKEIHIQLSMPKIQLPSRDDVKDLLARVRIPQRLKRYKRLLIAGVLLLVLLIGGPQVLGRKQPTKTAQRSGQTSVLGAADVPQTPDFKTVLPAGKTIDQLGGWGRVSPANADPAFGYSDMLSGTHIVVSEQKLPDGFASDLNNQLARVVKQFGPIERLTTTDGAQVCIATAASGAQSVATSKDDLLILVRSPSKISDQLWSDYLYALE